MKRVIGLVITDTHLFEKRTKHDTFLENNIDIVSDIFDQAIEIALAYGLKYIFHAGDIFDSRKSQPQSLQQSFENILHKIREKDLVLIAIPGNHDKTDYSSSYSFLHPFAHSNPDHFKLFDEFTSMQIIEPGLSFDFMPYFTDDIYIDKLQKGIEANKGFDDRLLITHIGVNGAVMNNGQPVSSKVKPELFKSYKKVLIGHYHDPCTLGGNVFYIGSTHQHNFGENSSKGYTFIYDDLSLERREFDNTITYKTYVAKPKDITPARLNDLIKESGKGKVRLVLEGTEVELKTFDKTPLKLNGIQVDVRVQSVEKVEIENRVQKFDASMLTDQFEKFCKEKKYDHGFGAYYLNSAI